MAVDYVTFLLALDANGDNRAIQHSVAYRRTSAQPENAFTWKVTCDVAPPAIDAPPIESTEDKVARATSVKEAISLAKRDMKDTTGDVPRGAWLLAHYSAAKLRWDEVAVEPETTIGHVLKDPDVERGKRMCVDGSISSIERRYFEQRKVYVGRLEATDGDALSFLAVGSTGELVKRSTGRFCGVVIGKAGDAVSMVGMFDLPENRTPIVEQ